MEKGDLPPGEGLRQSQPCLNLREVGVGGEDLLPKPAASCVSAPHYPASWGVQCAVVTVAPTPSPQPTTTQAEF